MDTVQNDTCGDLCEYEEDKTFMGFRLFAEDHREGWQVREAVIDGKVMTVMFPVRHTS